VDQLLEGGGELGGALRRHEEAGHPVPDGLGDAADPVGHDRERVGGGLKVDEAEALDAVAVADARQGEDVGAVVDLGQLLVGYVAEEADGEVGSGGLRAQLLLVVALVAAADDPVLDPAAHLGGQHLQGLERDQLALAGVQPAHGQDHDLAPWRPLAPVEGDDREVGPEGAGRQEDLVGGVRESAQGAAPGCRS
jgi:hypothetical protein